jgi:hypothetical protein
LKISHYQVNQPLADTIFKTPVPAGYSAQTMVPDPYPINVEEKLPLLGWKRLGSGPSLEKLAAGKPLFLAISDPDCEVSKSAVRAIAGISESIQKKGGVCAAISLSVAGDQAPIFKPLPYYVDPTGKLISKLRVPGTPMFLLATSKGVVTRIWYGFDPGGEAEFKKDVLDWLGKPPTPQS